MVVPALELRCVYWLPEGSNPTEPGKSNHPVLVLKYEDAQHVQVLLITTFNNTLLDVRFPGDRGKAKRSRYLPLECDPPAPHPDSGCLLSIHTTGSPSMLSRQSYVHLEPFQVDSKVLMKLRSGATVKLTSEAYSILNEKLQTYNGNATTGGRRVRAPAPAPVPAAALVPARIPSRPAVAVSPLFRPTPPAPPQRTRPLAYTAPPVAAHNYPPIQQQPWRVPARDYADLEAGTTTPLLHSRGHHYYRHHDDNGPRRRQACTELMCVSFLFGAVALVGFTGWYLA